jgi:ParB family transcriptional regulator, chromosome partitioning protein
MEDKIIELSLEQIQVSPFQPRRHFAEEELNELAQSIKSIGLLQPPVVRWIEEGQGPPHYELIAGERRLRAAAMAGLLRIPVIVKFSTVESAAEASLIENVQRADLSPLEVAAAFQRLMTHFHLTQEELAEKVGKKRSTIANYLRLLGLPQKLRLALSEGKITMGHAKALLALENPTRQEEVFLEVLRKGYTVRETEKAVHRLLNPLPPKKIKKKDLSLAHLSSLEKKLEEKFGTKVKIDSHKERGTLSFYFYSLDDFDRLLALIDITELVE